MKSKETRGNAFTNIESQGHSHLGTNHELYDRAGCRKQQSEICIQIGTMASSGQLSTHCAPTKSCFRCTQFVLSTRQLVQDHGTWPVPNLLSFTNLGFGLEWSLQSTVSYTKTCFVPLFCCSVLSPKLNTVTTYQCIAHIVLTSDMRSHLLGSSPWQWLHQWPHFLHS